MSIGSNKRTIGTAIACPRSEMPAGGGINLTTGKTDSLANANDGVTQALSASTLKPYGKVGPSTISLNKEDTL